MLNARSFGFLPRLTDLDVVLPGEQPHRHHAPEASEAVHRAGAHRVVNLSQKI